MSTQTSEEPRVRARRPPRIQPLQILSFVFVGIVAVWLVGNFIKSPSHWFDLFLLGLTLGMVYALIALGYSLVYGILELINFAHGDVFMLGAMMTVSCVTWFGLEESGSVLVWIVPMLLIAAGFTGLLNTTIETVAYRPLRSAPRLAPLITAIGVSFILQNVGLRWKGPAPVSIRDDILPQGKIFTIGDADFGWDQLIVFAVTIPTLIVLVWLVQKTKQGKAMRAVAQDKDAAAMMGIDVNRTITFTFLIAGLLAGFAGTLYALFVTNVQLRHRLQARAVRLHRRRAGRDRQPARGGARRDLHRADRAVQQRPRVAHAGRRLDQLADLRGPDPDPRLPPGGPARRTHTGRRLTWA